MTIISSFSGNAFASSNLLNAAAMPDSIPDGIDSVTWNLSSPSERETMLRGEFSVMREDGADDATVVGEYPNLVDPLSPGSGGDWSGGDGNAGGGGGGTSQTNLPPKEFLNEPLSIGQESQADARAKEFREAVQQDGRYAANEAGAAILRLSNGTIVLGPIYWGSPNSVTIGFGDYNVHSTQVIGTIHSHPTVSSLVDRNYDAALSPSPNDWAAAEPFRAKNSAFYREYIIGPDTAIRQYGFDDPRGVANTDVVT